MLVSQHNTAQFKIKNIQNHKNLFQNKNFEYKKLNINHTIISYLHETATSYR